MGRRAVVALVGAVVTLAVAVLVFQSGLWVSVLGTGEYDRGTVTVHEGNATAGESTATDGNATTVAVTERKASVEVRIADTFNQRYVGLSETAELGPNEGMLFVHDEEAEYAYVMRNMSFPLDIIFIDANGTITTIHHAPLPPEGTEESELKRYEGRGKYVLEVNRGWANRTNVSVGDQVQLPAAATDSDSA